MMLWPDDDYDEDQRHDGLDAAQGVLYGGANRERLGARETAPKEGEESMRLWLDDDYDENTRRDGLEAARGLMYGSAIALFCWGVLALLTWGVLAYLSYR